NVEKLIEGIAVRQPGGPFLVGREEVPKAIEREANREPDAGGDYLPRGEIGSDPLDRAALATEVKVTASRSVDQVGVGEVAGADPEVDAVVGSDGHAKCVDSVRDF